MFGFVLVESDYFLHVLVGKLDKDAHLVTKGQSITYDLCLYFWHPSSSGFAATTQ
jgi:hypothetical protein